jgi:hypothetical protein
MSGTRTEAGCLNLLDRGCMTMVLLEVALEGLELGAQGRYVVRHGLDASQKTRRATACHGCRARDPDQLHLLLLLLLL